VTRRVVGTRDRSIFSFMFIIYPYHPFCCPQFLRLATSLVFFRVVRVLVWHSFAIYFRFPALLEPTVPIVLRCWHMKSFMSSMPYIEGNSNFILYRWSKLRVGSAPSYDHISTCNIGNAQVFFSELRFLNVWKSSKSLRGGGEGLSPLITSYHGLREY
jgi:hypothetical protein